jgi:acyl-CoA synthetase (AMP-forming)/AMP-acid ligase II
VSRTSGKIILGSHLRIQDAAVIGIPNVKGGRDTSSIAGFHWRATANSDELAAYCHVKLTRYKIGKRLEFLNSLPCNPKSKFLIKLLGC